jgi:hypothetical protein
LQIDDKTFEAMSKIYIKINDDYIPLEEVTYNELPVPSNVPNFKRKIIETMISHWRKEDEKL